MNTLSSHLRTVWTLGASDLHFRSTGTPTIRLDGKILPFPPEPALPSVTQDMLKELLNAHQKAHLARHLAVEFGYQHSATGRRCRVSMYYQKGTLQAAFRMLPQHPGTQEELGLPPILQELASRKRGLLLVTGPVGTGKTTTLNWMIDHINRTTPCRIITIEDPIEYVHEDKLATVAQREMGRDCTTFAEALVQSLRHDPDVLCVGEMRDKESIQAALTAAETGHLVLSTLHTSSAALAVDRIVDAFPGASHDQIRTQLANALLGIVSQKLLPRMEGKGRVAAFEILLATAAVRHLIRDNRAVQLPSQMSLSREQGMMTMDQCIQELYLQGAISRDTALSAMDDPYAVDSLPPAHRASESLLF